MADIRIKDLTTTASSTASDDFIAVDGTTNGTRKLSAFSPTFGGNATVTGTLTVSGATMSVGGGSGSIVSALDGTAGNYKLHLFRSGGVDRWYCGLQAATETGSNAGAPFGITALSDAGAQIDVPLQITRAAGGAVTIVRPTAITNTTASTTTSSGALVVGNGTSGGLGVGGSICLGANIVSAASDGKFQITGTGNTTGTKELTFQRADGGDSTAFGLTGSAYAGVLTGLGNNEAYLYTSNAFAFRIFIGTAATNRFDFTNSQFKINPTTASTSTSSGALVVSGGVGVAGAINAGGTITSVNGSGSGLLGMRSSSGNASYVFWSETGVADRGILGFNNGSSTLSYRSFSSSFATGTEVFSISSGGNVTAGGSVQTAAPSGGTAAAWKLGTVASVSPTSPNRTIEVDIGGTIYYIHAKTTNN